MSEFKITHTEISMMVSVEERRFTSWGNYELSVL
jgi:hypothetical protein